MTQLAASKLKFSGFPLEFDGTSSPVKTVLFLLICAAWLLPGLLGHDPWKTEEAVTLGAVNGMLSSGDWVVPTLAGEPYLARPPLYYLTAIVFIKAFSFLFPLHDAARLATAFYMVLTLIFTGLAGIALYGGRFGRVTVMILIGNLGLLIRSHEMNSDIALLCGYAIALYGMVLCSTRFVLGGALLGTGIGIGFMSRGLIAPLIIGSIALLLPVMFRDLRSRGVSLFYGSALLAALPWLLLWPLALWQRSPQLFETWFWVNNVNLLADFAGRADLLFYFNSLPWYAWPSLPLALWTLWEGGKRGFRRKEIQLPLLAFIVMLVFLSLSPLPREAGTMPMLLPLTLLAAAGIDTLRRGAASALDWFGMMTFGLFSALLWLGWLAMVSGKPEAAARSLREYHPGFLFQFDPLPFVFALALTVIWLVAITRSRRSNRRAIVNWTAGITTFWMLAMTLWLPFVDAGRSYRFMITELRAALPTQYDCVATQGIGESQRALLDYFASIRTQQAAIGQQTRCGFLLDQGTAKIDPLVGNAWRLRWEGSRPGDRTERYRLYERT